MSSDTQVLSVLLLSSLRPAASWREFALLWHRFLPESRGRPLTFLDSHRKEPEVSEAHEVLVGPADQLGAHGGRVPFFPYLLTSQRSEIRVSRKF